MIFFSNPNQSLPKKRERERDDFSYLNEKCSGAATSLRPAVKIEKPTHGAVPI